MFTDRLNMAQRPNIFFFLTKRPSRAIMISGRPIRFSQSDGSGNSREIPPGPKGKRRLRVRGRFSFFSPRNRRFRGPLGERRKKGPHGPSGRASAQAKDAASLHHPVPGSAGADGCLPFLSKGIMARPRENVKGEDAFFSIVRIRTNLQARRRTKKKKRYGNSFRARIASYGLARGLFEPLPRLS